MCLSGFLEGDQLLDREDTIGFPRVTILCVIHLVEAMNPDLRVSIREFKNGAVVFSRVYVFLVTT